MFTGKALTAQKKERKYLLLKHLSTYRDQLSQNLLTKQYFIEVDLNHLINYNADLANKLSNSPAEFLPLVSWVDSIFMQKVMTN